jgi:hypothetical protein
LRVDDKYYLRASQDFPVMMEPSSPTAVNNTSGGYLSEKKLTHAKVIRLPGGPVATM